jgi:hypothetical protein
MSDRINKTLDYQTYTELSLSHRGRIEGMLGSFYEDRGHGVRHAILDFLVEYYSFRRSKLSLWTPGLGIRVEHNPNESLEGSFWDYSGGYSFVSKGKLNSKKMTGLHWIHSLLQAVENRPPVYHCYGMHEWAMVFRTSEIRHPYLKLRLSHGEIDSFVESQPIGCSHVDAFRFFTEPARPLNKFQPNRETQIQMDQPGCLHVTMDLYKWAYKGWPWIPSDILADALELAIDTRILDMQASPYDVSMYGYEAIPIETETGRQTYSAQQEVLSRRAEPIRKRLIAAYERLLDEGHLVGDHNSGRLESVQVQPAG